MKINSVFCKLNLKIEGNMDVKTMKIDCALAKELLRFQFRRQRSPITSHAPTPFKRPGIIEEMCLSLCGNKPCTENTGTPEGCQHFQSNNLIREGADMPVCAHTGRFSPPANSPADVQFDQFKALTTIKSSTPLKGASLFHSKIKTALNDIEDLDDTLLEVEETEVDAVGPLNLASEEVGVILQEFDDNHIDNTVSLVLKCGDMSRITDETVCECKYVSDSQLYLSPPNASNLPENYLVIDETPARYLCDVLSTDVTVLKVEQEVNQSLNSLQHNPNSLHEGGDIKESNRPYYLSAEEVALFSRPPVCAGEAVDERSHAGSSNEADSRKPSETLVANPASCSPDSHKDCKLTFWKQVTSERVVSFIEEKANDAEVKKNFRCPVRTEHKAKKQKTSPSCKQDASKLKKRIVEAVKKKNIQKCNPAKKAPAKKAPEHKRRQRTWLNFMSEVEIERRKHLYLQFVSNHLNNGHEIQGPMQELLCLMDQVAESECRNHSSSWQHPSDLTTRNYSRQNMNSFNKPNLYQWANSNGRFYRFSGMPDGFQRSPIL